MSNIAQKLSLQTSLGNLAKKGADTAIGLLGKSFPASVVSINGRMVTIKFEVLSDYNLPQITVPLAGSEYTKEPIQAGCKGIVIPCDIDISGVSGTSTATADLTPSTNLSSLVFFPIGNKNWKVEDPNIYYATGLTDIMLRNNTHQLLLEDENAAWLSIISQLNSLLLTIGAGLTTPTVLTPITAATNPVKARV